MTASLPQDVQAVFGAYMTTEYTTIDRTGQPITWPVTPYYSPGASCIDVTTALGHPKKADDARANSLVSLLFSEPTGSGLDEPPIVLVQGSAEVDDRDLGANRARFVRESAEKRPLSRSTHLSDAVKRRLGFRYDPIYIHVRPERVYVWPKGDLAAEPLLYDAHMEEVRSGHSEEPARDHADPVGGVSRWDPQFLEIGTRYRSGVLSIVGPDGFPFSIRMPVSLDAAERWISIGGDPEWAPLAEGLACLTLLEHDESRHHQETFQVRGDLVLREGGWSLIPRRALDGRALERASS
jgi:hypothetical protein